MLRRAPLACLTLTLCACAQRLAGAPPAEPSPAPAAAPQREPVARRELPPSATFGDLVRLAAQLDGTQAERSECLLTGAAGALRLTGEVTGALRPLPLPSVDLDEALEGSVSVNVLSLFGRHGDTAGALTLAAFSAAPPTRDAAALIMTDRGIYLRGTSAALAPANRKTLPAALAAVEALRDVGLFVAAEAQVPMSELSQLLTALQELGRPAALGVNLAPNTVLPERGASGGDAVCPSGLPETDAAQGELSVAQLQAGLKSLPARAADCLAQADARGAAGGKLKLALRIAATGNVQTACIVSDETDDHRLRACILTEARKLAFAVPQPHGSVDAELPLQLRAQPFVAPALLCLQ